MVQFKASLASRAISKAITREVQRDSRKLEKEILEAVEQQIDLAFDPVNSPEVDSMINGRSISSLKAGLGLTGAELKIDSMKRSIVASTRITRQPSAGRKLARLNVDFTPDIDELGNNNWAFQGNSGKNGPPFLPWFTWMTKFGLNSPSPGWNTFNAGGTPASTFSRSKTNVVMRRSRARSWNVPVSFAGTPQNNFVTRALNKRFISLRRQVDQALRRSIDRIRRRLR